MFQQGQIVISKSGRDKGKPFIIVDVDETYVYLVDGQIRKLDKPKKKKHKHVQPTNTINLQIKDKLKANEYLQDACFKQGLRSFAK